AGGAEPHTELLRKNPVCSYAPLRVPFIARTQASDKTHRLSYIFSYIPIDIIWDYKSQEA
ncbi:MAG: hypothetical protein J0H04_06535, partial [Hyphomicrobium denitrificans]|nr:hypothetical protein [Hyphomicrobium denitrificans]